MGRNLYNDTELIGAIKSGDATQERQAFHQLYKDEVVIGKIKIFIQDFGGKHDADDVLQESIIKLRRAIIENKFEGRSKVRTFLIGICYNEIRDKSKVTKYKPAIDLKDDFSTIISTSLIENIYKNLFLEERNDIKFERNNILKALLQRLSEKCRKSLHLKYYEDETMVEIARARQLKNANQAKKAVDRCRKKLRELIISDPHLEKYLKGTL